MVVPTGTASPWREVPHAECEEGEIVYLRDGWVTESADLLAEAMRADGVVRTLSVAIPIAEEARLDACWYGYLDGDNEEVFCSEDGETEDGEWVDEVYPCIKAVVNVLE